MASRSTLLLKIAFVLAAVALAAPGIARSQDDDPDTIQRAGLRYFKQGEYEKALSHFEAVKGALSGEDRAERRRITTRLIRQMGEELVLQLHTADHSDEGIQARIRGYAAWLLSTAERGVSEYERDQDDIRRVLERAMRSNSAVDRSNWMEAMRIRFGEFAVPEIHRAYFQSENAEMRGRAQQLLLRIGRVTVPALIEILDSPSASDRTMAALTLGDFADDRAAPALMERIQDANELPEVKTQCRLALAEMGGSERFQGMSASDAYYDLARRYYRQSPDLMIGRTDAWVIWQWVPIDADDPSRGGHLDYDHTTPIWLYMDIMANEACVDALRLNTNLAKAWDLLHCINAHQYLESQARLESSTAEEREFFAKWFDASHRALVLSGLGGGPPGQAGRGQLELLRAIKLALEDRRAETAIQLMRNLVSIGDRRHVPRPSDYDPDRRGGYTDAPGVILAKALTFPDKRVQYVAAQTLYSLSPDRDFARSSLASKFAIQAISETVQRSVFVITESQGLRNHLTQQLNLLGYFPEASATVPDGMRRLKEFIVPDVLVLDAKLALEPLRVVRGAANPFRSDPATVRETIFDLLQDDPRTGPGPGGKPRLPIVILYDADTTTEETLRGELAAGFVHNQIRGFLRVRNGKIDNLEAELATFDPIWRDKEADSKGKADAIAIATAEALRNIDPASTAHNVLPFAQALIGRVKADSTSTAVKVACLETLAHFAAHSANSGFDGAWWRDSVVGSLIGDTEDLGVLRSEAANDRPIVKELACNVLQEIYRVYEMDSSAGWGTTLDDRNEPFYSLLWLIDFAPAGLDDSGADEDLRAAFQTSVRAVRVAAARAMQAAPLTNQQALHVLDRKRMTRKEDRAYQSGD